LLFNRIKEAAKWTWCKCSNQRFASARSYKSKCIHRHFLDPQINHHFRLSKTRCHSAKAELSTLPFLQIGIVCPPVL